MNTYSIHTKDKMYTIQAAYFKADDTGVMFFNREDEGIGFVPSYTLDLVRLETRSKDIENAIRRDFNEFIKPNV